MDQITALPAQNITRRQESESRVLLKLERELGPQICEALKDETVFEIMLNPDGNLWIERMGRGMERVGRMAPTQAESIITTVASMLKTVVTWHAPILLCELPLDGSRFTGKMPPVVEAPSFTIRRHAIRVFSLADYVEANIMSALQAEALRHSVIKRDNILVVGSTGSGKTTLVNAIIGEMAVLTPKHRLILIEDTRELQILSPNYVVYRSNPRQTQVECVRTSLRDRPDRIIIGEARDGAAALEMLKAWNTGHPGGVATIHANSAFAGLIRLGQLCAEVTVAPQHEVIAEAIDIVVFIDKQEDRREIKEVMRVHRWDDGKYITSNVM
jgi:type IV secretion system protein TrbB